MTRDQYVALVTACDEVLRDSAAPPDVAAVPWLHVIREHPVFLDRYAGVFGAAPDRRARLRLRAAGLWHAYGRRRLPLDTAGDPIDVLIVSHLLNAGQLNPVDDFYFGSVPRDLQQLGYRVVVALIDHSESRVPLTTGREDRLVLPASLSRAEERRIGRRLSTVARYLKQSSRQATGVAAAVRREAARHALDPEARVALRVAAQVESLVRARQPKLVMTTHEGHSWERMLAAAARRANPAVRVAGYHATALFSLQHALTRNLARAMNPDVIFTAGHVTRDAIASRSSLPDTSVIALGSNRRLDTATVGDLAQRRACVVIPEGILSECRILFRAAVAAARLQPDITWFLRLHPQLSFDIVRPEFEGDGPLPANVVLSTRPMPEDFAASGWALYRGSSAGIQALAAGLRPMYFDAGDAFTIDPMFDLDRWKVRVASPADAVAVVTADLAAAPATLDAQRREGQAYAARYFSALDVRAVSALLD